MVKEGRLWPSVEEIEKEAATFNSTETSPYLPDHIHRTPHKLAALSVMATKMLEMRDEDEKTGRDSLRNWFELSYASWLTLPRVMMHAMPQRWQAQMARLLEEWDEYWDTNDLTLRFVVRAKSFVTGRFAKVPDWLQNYRHPNKCELEYHKRPAREDD